MTDPNILTAPLNSLIAAADALGTGRGNPEVIKLYTDWLAAQPVGSRDAHCAWFNLATEYSNSGDAPNAMHAYQSALSLRPDFHPAALNLGSLLESKGRPADALQVWASAIQTDDARVALLNQRARLLETSGQLADAAEVMRTSLLTRVDQPDVTQHWVHARQKMCQWPVLADTIPGLKPEDLLAQSGPLASLAITDDVVSQRIVANTYVERKTQPTPEHLAPLDGYRHDRIRIGYLSSDFCSHAMSYLIVELFERHDRSRFEVYGYCVSPEDGSPIRDRVIAAFDHFSRLKEMTDEAAARRIRADEIDILIDLNGLTSGGRLQILRWKPAPLQATYLGFIGPVPLPELDYMICDDFVVPPEIAHAYQPTPLPIEKLYQANDSKRVLGTPMTRAQAGLPDDKFVFCCFSNYYKITEAMFAGWMEILRHTTDSVIWLVDDNQWTKNNLRLRAMVAGIDPARLIFAVRVDPASYMSRLAVANVFLDTFPYNAGTIASDAIRMGLPLVTLAGRAFASRMAASLLHAIGADEGVTTTLPEYVATAIALVNDRDRYTAFRAKFTEAAWATTIGDIEGFSRRYENALMRVHDARTKVSAEAAE